MLSNEREAPQKEGFTRLHSMPGRGTGRVGQWDEAEANSGVGEAEHSAHDRVEAGTGEELLDGKFANGDDKGWPKNLDLAVEPMGTIGDFQERRHAVAARFLFTWKAAADSGHVNAGTELRFIQARGLFEPAEEGFASGPGEGAAEDRFFIARGLADEHHFTENGAAADDGLVHGGAAGALEQLLDMQLEQTRGCAFGRGRHQAPESMDLLAATAAVASAIFFCRSQWAEMRMQISIKPMTGMTMKMVLKASGVTKAQTTMMPV